MSTDDWLNWTKARLTDEGGEVVYALGTGNPFWRVHAGMTREDGDATAFSAESSREAAVVRMAREQGDPQNAHYTEWWISRYDPWTFVVREDHSGQNGQEAPHA